MPIDFEAKKWLFILPFIAVGLILLYRYGNQRRKRRLSHFASARLLPGLSASFSSGRLRLKQALVLLVMIGLLTALAQPKWGHDWKEVKSRGIDILIALDSSKSMLAEDIAPNRLERARWAILDLIEKLESDRIGLIAFAGSAFLECPLTLDYDAFRQALEAIDTEIIPQGGTDIAAALSEAEAAFATDNHHKVLILITDGEDLEASGIEKAREAAESGIMVFTVGVGSQEGELIPLRQSNGSLDFLRDAQGKIVKTSLDESTLSTIAQVTGAFYTPLGAAGEGLDRLYSEGLQVIPEREYQAQLKKTGIHRFQWPLMLAILFLYIEPFISLRRHSVK